VPNCCRLRAGGKREAVPGQQGFATKLSFFNPPSKYGKLGVEAGRGGGEIRRKTKNLGEEEKGDLDRKGKWASRGLVLA